MSTAELLYRTNLFAIVSGGPNPKYADNSVMVFDDRAGKINLLTVIFFFVNTFSHSLAKKLWLCKIKTSV